MLSHNAVEPLAVETTSANVPEQDTLGPLLAAMPNLQGPRGAWPKSNSNELVGDRAYGVTANATLLAILGIVNLLASSGGDTHGSGLGAIRYVIERTLVRFGQFRHLKVCHDRTGRNWQGWLHNLAAPLLT